jgi:Rrf2 family protein
VISKTEEYALRAVVHLARDQTDGPRRTTEVAEAIDIPANYLSKILHRLGRHGVVASERGRHGGFRLGREASEITLADVVAPFGALEGRQRCLLGLKECSDEHPCGAHERWKIVRRATSEFFAETTVADVIRGMDNGDSKIKSGS